MNTYIKLEKIFEECVKLKVIPVVTDLIITKQDDLKLYRDTIKKSNYFFSEVESAESILEELYSEGSIDISWKYNTIKTGKILFDVFEKYSFYPLINEKKKIIKTVIQTENLSDNFISKYLSSDNSSQSCDEEDGLSRVEIKNVEDDDCGENCCENCEDEKHIPDFDSDDSDIDETIYKPGCNCVNYLDD